jgi:hypothetical protein
MSPRPWLLGLTLLACRPPVSAPVDGTLAFEPADVAMGDVYEGHRRATGLDLVLSSRSGCADVQLGVTGGFSVDEGATVQLAGGERKTLTVRPPAAGLGEHAGTVTAEGCALSASATLSVKLVPQPSCESGSSCRTARFDTESGACVGDAVAEGTPCADACLTAATCTSGECRGQAKSCEDNDPCTLDVCSAGAGCQNLPAGLLCPPPAQCPSACLGPTCALGNAQLLWSLPTQDVLGAPHPDLAADDDGNLYWLESTDVHPHTVSLVSATLTGALRYRRTFLHVAGNAYLAPMIVGDTVLLTPDGFGSWSYAFRASDGQPLWQQRLRVLYGVGNTNTTSWVDHGTALGDGSVVFALTFSAGTSPPAAVMSVEASSGKKLWSFTEPNILWGVAADEERNLYLDPKSNPVTSRDSAGRARFSSETEMYSAISSGRVFGQDSVVSTTDGKKLYTFPAPAYAWVAGPEIGVRSADGRKLDIFRTADGTVRGAADLTPAYVQDVMLTRDGDVLLISGAPGEAPVLRGVNADGEQQFACKLPGPGPYLGPGVLRDGKFFVLEQPMHGAKGTLRAFLVAGQSLATRGWATGGATPQRTQRPASGP